MTRAHPRLDRAIKTFYPPGSTWKLAMAAMALRRGLVTLHSHMPIPCRGGLQYGNRFFRCWDAHGHGDLTLTEAIAQSCDVYFYHRGTSLAANQISEARMPWAFGVRPVTDWPGESRPRFPTAPGTYNGPSARRGWTSAVAMNVAIGQGENAQRLGQMVGLCQQLAGDGRFRTPFVVRATTSPATENMSLDLNADQLATLRRAMIAVVEQGTARGS